MSSSTTSKSTIARRVAVATTALGAGLAVAVLTAPTAAAAVTSINVAAGASFGSSTPFGTGCSYTVTAVVTNPNEPVFVDDNNVPIGPGPITPNAGTATVTWTPTTPGSHVLRAFQFGPFGQQDTQVNVGNGINLGSSCVVL